MFNFQMTLPTLLHDQIQCCQGAVRAVRYNTDGEYCLTGGADKTVKLWNPMKKLLLKSYVGHGFEVADVRASFDNSQLCSGGLDKIVILWDVATGASARRFRFHAGRINAVAFNDEATVILSAGMDGKVCVWDCKSKSPAPLQIMDEAKDSVTGARIHKWQLLSSSLDGYIRRYDIRKGLMTEDYVGQPVTSFSVTQDGQCGLCSFQDSVIRLFDLGTGELLNEYTGHLNTTYQIENGIIGDAHIVSGSEDGNLYIWDLITTKKVEQILHKKSKIIASVCVHPNERQIITATQDFLNIWASPSDDTKG